MSKRSVAAAIIKRLAGLFIILLMFLMPTTLRAQELDAQVSFNTSKIQGTERSVFTSLQNAVQELLRTQSWTDYHFAENERIQCVFAFTVNKYEQSTGNMECELIVQSNRPVFNSSYYTTVFNFRDPSVDFTYTEQDRLDYTPGNVGNNLVAVLAYYSLLVIGLDFDTMSLYGGTDILRQAETLAASSQSLGIGWRSFDTNTSRYTIINDYLNGTLAPFRELQYKYHRKGLDDMATNADRGRATITESLELLSSTRQAKSTSALPDLFTEIKKNELLSIYSKGMVKEKEKVADLLTRINPSFTSDWNTIKTQ